MTKILLSLRTSLACAFLLVALVLPVGKSNAEEHANGVYEIRIGWQIPWATQGQLVQVWKHTDILKKNGLSAVFIGRTYGPILNEVALAGGIDVILTADQPAAALFSKRKGWVGIGRLMYNRTLTYVPPNSPIQSMSELKGKTIGVPVGAAAERGLNGDLEASGVDPKHDVTIINVGIREQVPLVGSGKNKPTWGNLDALSGFDPVPAIFESQGLIRVLSVSNIVSVVLMNEAFIEKHPGVAKRVMQALFDAYDYYRQHQKEAGDWFIKEARLRGVDYKALDIAASVEPNVWVTNRADIRVSFTEEDFLVMQKGADFLEPKVGPLDMRDFVTNKYTTGVE